MVGFRRRCGMRCGASIVGLECGLKWEPVAVPSDKPKRPPLVKLARAITMANARTTPDLCDTR